MRKPRKIHLLIIYLATTFALFIPLDVSKRAVDGVPKPSSEEHVTELKTLETASFELLERIPVNAEDYVRAEAKKYGWHEGYEWEQLHTLIKNESGWNPYVWNKQGSGACGLFQALPCSKLGAPLEDVKNQARWGVAYIKGYGSPSKALSFWHCTGWCYSSRVNNMVFKHTTWY